MLLLCFPEAFLYPFLESHAEILYLTLSWGDAGLHGACQISLFEFLDCVDDVIFLFVKRTHLIDVGYRIVSIVQEKFVVFNAEVVFVSCLCLNLQFLKDMLHVGITESQLGHLSVSINNRHIGHKLTLQLGSHW